MKLAIGIQHNSSVATDFSEALKFSYVHLARKCHHEVVLKGFGEQLQMYQNADICCDVCMCFATGVSKKLPLQNKGQNKPGKPPTIGATVKAKYDGEWFIGELVAYNKEIDQWTIYLKEDDYTDVIFPDDDLRLNDSLLAI